MFDRHILFSLLLVLSVSSAMADDPPRKATAISKGLPQVKGTEWIHRQFKDIAYAGLSPAQKLDIYLPNEGEGPFPVIVFIHGGAFLSGDKADGQLDPELPSVRHGYALVSVNYRLSREAPFPAAVEDIKAAVRYLRAHARKYRLDGGRIAAWGDSAGGYFAAMLGTTCHDRRFDSAKLGNKDRSSAVQAVVDWFGPIYFDRLERQFRESGKAPAGRDESQTPSALYLGAPPDSVPGKVKAACPATYATADIPPFLIEHGEKDRTIPVQQSVEFAEELRKLAGTDRVVLRLLPGADHADGQFGSEQNLAEVFDFLDGVFGKEPKVLTRISDAKGRPLPALPHKPLPKRSVAKGLFQPNWASLAENYKCPDWFRDAKFGIWAHWSAQCQPEKGDWYARRMYMPGDWALYDHHVSRYGHPSEFGFKDIDNAWHAEHWNPEKLMALYKAAGAKYFVALANHHDNFDCYDSTYQEWNSVRVGPHKDIVGTWEKAARAEGLRFGVSNHSSHAWHWFQPAYGYDAEGPKAGVRYDGWLTKEDGKGKWWEGLDPQELYSGANIVVPDGITSAKDMQAWYDKYDNQWFETPPPNNPYFADKWYLRTQELVDKYRPDLLYFDDTELPLSQAGLDIAAHYYNSNMALHGGKLEAVINGKLMTPEHRPALVEDHERGFSNVIFPQPWQTDTCIGNWHYDRAVFENHGYKSVEQVVQMLVDIVSKNGNLLLSVPVRGDGTLDPDEVKFLKGMADWMAVNQEGIFGTRPWEVFGEGIAKVKESTTRFTSKDIRFTTKDGTLYATVMAWPENGQVLVRSLAAVKGEGLNGIQTVGLLGYDGKLDWKQDAEGLRVTLPAKRASEYTLTLKIKGTDLKAVPYKPDASEAAALNVPKPVGTVYEAEDAALSGGAAVASDHEGFLGKGFVAGYYQGTGQKTLFTVKTKAGGKHKGTFRYSSAIGSPQTLGLYVNGKFVRRLSFQNTADWESWADLALDMFLRKGKNSVSLQKEDGDGCINLDYLDLQ